MTACSLTLSHVKSGIGIESCCLQSRPETLAKGDIHAALQLREDRTPDYRLTAIIPSDLAGKHMRYSKDHKDETRAQILSAAARLFRTEGIASVSVADVMADVGLTHGGFYRYFPSKEALVKESVASAVAATSEYLASQMQVGVGGLEGLLRAYLRDARRDSPHNGCVFSILTAEMARRPDDSKESFLEGLDIFVDLIFEELPVTLPEAERRRRATVIFGLMVGVMQIARLMGSDPASDAILDEGIRSALQLAAGGPETGPAARRKA